MARREFKFTNLQLDKLNKVQEVLNELDEYKPLTLRQIYYQLVGKGNIPNNKSQYGMLSNLLKWARINGFISWNDIEDRVRVYKDLTGFENKEQFIKQEISFFLRGYKRSLLQSQDIYIECWIEKDALRSIFTKIAQQYSVPVVVCRGFSSASFLNDFKERVDIVGKRTTMLYFGDFDPSGIEMLDAMKTTLEEEMGVVDVEFKRVALLKGDISKYKLPHNPDAIKKQDTRTAKHVSTYGDLAVELDALPPSVLEEKIKKSIEAELDISSFEYEKHQHLSDLQEISLIKQKIETYMQRYQP
jgi:hypothetical protein